MATRGNRHPGRANRRRLKNLTPRRRKSDPPVADGRQAWGKRIPL